jgi:hypothetical protein
MQKLEILVGVGRRDAGQMQIAEIFVFRTVHLTLPLSSSPAEITVSTAREATSPSSDSHSPPWTP